MNMFFSLDIFFGLCTNLVGGGGELHVVYFWKGNSKSSQKPVVCFVRIKKISVMDSEPFSLSLYFVLAYFIASCFGIQTSRCRLHTKANAGKLVINILACRAGVILFSFFRRTEASSWWESRAPSLACDSREGDLDLKKKKDVYFVSLSHPRSQFLTKWRLKITRSC